MSSKLSMGIFSVENQDFSIFHNTVSWQSLDQIKLDFMTHATQTHPHFAHFMCLLAVK